MPKAHPKRRFLEDMGALHQHPERVRAEIFERHRFFDSLDKVQVKYEMLRAQWIGISIAATQLGGRPWVVPKQVTSAHAPETTRPYAHPPL